MENENRTTQSNADQLTKCMSKQNRNDPCLCGSGKKYKKCCIDKIESFQPTTSSIIFYFELFVVINLYYILGNG